MASYIYLEKLDFADSPYGENTKVLTYGYAVGSDIPDHKLTMDVVLQGRECAIPRFSISPDEDDAHTGLVHEVAVAHINELARKSKLKDKKFPATLRLEF